MKFLYSVVIVLRDGTRLSREFIEAELINPQQFADEIQELQGQEIQCVEIVDLGRIRKIKPRTVFKKEYDNV